MIDVTILECAFRKRELLSRSINQKCAVDKEAAIEPPEQKPSSEIERFSKKFLLPKHSLFAKFIHHSSPSSSTKYTKNNSSTSEDCPFSEASANSCFSPSLGSLDHQFDLTIPNGQPVGPQSGQLLTEPLLFSERSCLVIGRRFKDQSRLACNLENIN